MDVLFCNQANLFPQLDKVSLPATMCHSKRRKRWAELLSVRSCSKFCRWFQRSCPTSLLFWFLFAETSSNATTETPPTHPPTNAPNDSRTTIPFITTTSTPSTTYAFPLSSNQGKQSTLTFQPQTKHLFTFACTFLHIWHFVVHWQNKKCLSGLHCNDESLCF